MTELAPVTTNGGDLCTVVIVSYRTGPVLIDSLRAALTQGNVDRVVVVDNGNSLETRRHLQSMADDDQKLQIVSGHGNVGFSKGCNIGARHATGRYLLLLNPDCVMQPGVIRRGIEELQKHPHAAALTVRIENPDGSEQRGARRNLMTPWTCIVEQFRFDRLMPNHPHFERMNLNDAPPLTEVAPVPCISGAFMLMPKAVFDEVGGMDEDYFLHVEDIDFCLRINKLNRQILFVPDAVVTHVKSTSNASPLAIEWHKSVSAITYFHKHFRPQYPKFMLRLVAFAIFSRMTIRAVPLTLRWLWTRRTTPSSYA